MRKNNALDFSDKIIKVDTSFLALRKNLKKKEREKRFKEYLLSIATFLTVEEQNISVDFLINCDVDLEGKRFIAVCLLRLFTIKDFSIEDFISHKFKVFAFFDKIIDEKIYNFLKLKPTDQTFEKELKLRELTSSVEKNINNELYSLTSLQGLSSFRGRYLKVINNNVSSFILNEFLGDDLTSSVKLNEVFSLITKYVEKKQKNAVTVDTFNNAFTALEEFILETKQFKTEYHTKYVLGLAEKIKLLLNHDISKLDSFKPTNVKLEQIDKKYPLHEKNRNVLISIDIINIGPGYAFDVELNIKTLFDNIKIDKPFNYIGKLEPSSINFHIPVTVLVEEAIALIQIELVWKNFDNSIRKEEYEFEIEGQRSDIPWEEIRFEQPYSLEAVETTEELVGREEIVDKLLRQTLTKNIGSSYIFGQKRVGKTSIVKTLRSRILSDDYLVIFLESGDYICPTAKDTVIKLGRKICQKINTFNTKFSSLKIPEFTNGAFSSLIDYLDSVLTIDPKIKILIILDEFDELPKELYKRGDFGDSFFLTIRSISQKTPFGFILVGGEKIAYIMSCQGHALNKFRSMRVDYFTKENYWNDFTELIRRPVKKWFEISDTAINDLYIETAGNPFYAKWICSNMFDLMVNLRDCHVSSTEIDVAVDKSLSEIASNSFQHFWDDAIFEDSGELFEEISIKRRRLLLAFASINRSNKRPSNETISNHEFLAAFGSDDILTELDQFVRRKIFIKISEYYEIKIDFFKKWLINSGFNDILTTFIDKDAVLKRKQKEEESFITPEEIIELTERWPHYKGQKISNDKVRSWLNQFGNNTKQRLMFKILQSINFYSFGRVREKLRQSHEIVRRGITVYKSGRKQKQDEFLISYLDSPGKSGGGYYAKLYADENKIYYKNVITKESIGKVLKNNEKAQALIFIDDFIGTGGTAKKYFSEIESEFGDTLRENKIKLYFLAICGFEHRKDELDDLLNELNLPVNTHICDPFDDSVKCFHHSSTIFSSQQEREEAKQLAYEYGTKLVNKNYLGYGDCQTAIIFETNCPNNNLPIFWERSGKNHWTPLFPRK